MGRARVVWKHPQDAVAAAHEDTEEDDENGASPNFKSYESVVGSAGEDG